MIYRILADLLVLLHLAFVICVVSGGLLVLWRRRMAFLHVPVALWGVYVELAGKGCPLTSLEIRFRTQGGQAGYAGGFVDHYLMPVLYPPGLTRGQQVWLGVAVGVVNVAVYAVVVRKWIRERGGEVESSP
jgi:hypothetical protein